jgi:sugar phosphate isomerase/epimerase
MRIAAFPKGLLGAMVAERTMTVFEWIDQARATLPVDGLELHSGFFWDTSPAGIDRVGEALHEAGFQMPMLCAAPDFTNPDADQRKREFDQEAEMIGIAARLGGPGTSCRVLSGQDHPGLDVEQGLEWAVDAITRLIPIAREHGVTLSLENHYKADGWLYPEFAQRAELFFQLLDRIPERVHFGVQYDPSNAIVAGDDPIALLEAVADRVVSMHASDRSLAEGTTLDELRQTDGTLGYSPNLRHGVTGKGLNDYNAIFRILAAHHYRGWVSIEDGMNGLSEMAESLAFLRAMSDKYF